MIGHSLFLHSGSFISDDAPAVWNWQNENVIWYDFTDATTIFQDKTGSSVVTADGQNVQRVNNKSTHSRKISTHVEAIYSSNEPVYKTGGTENLNYVQFSGDRLFAGKTNFGATNSSPIGTIDGSSIFNSDTSLGSRSTSTFIVLSPNSSWAGSDTIFHITGEHEDHVDEDGSMGFHYNLTRDSTNDDHPRAFLDFQYPIVDQLQNAGNVGDLDITVDQTHIITHRLGHSSLSDNVNNGAFSIMWLDGYNASKDDITVLNSYPVSAINDYSFKEQSDPSVLSIGAASNTSSPGSALNGLEANLYEIIIFDYTLTIEQNNTVETYLKNKYNIS